MFKMSLGGVCNKEVGENISVVHFYSTKGTRQKKCNSLSRDKKVWFR